MPFKGSLKISEYPQMLPHVVSGTHRKLKHLHLGHLHLRNPQEKWIMLPAYKCGY